MGLDMYLERFPRYKYYTAEDIYKISEYLDWSMDEDGKKYSLKEWCGVDESELPKKEDIEYFKKFFGTKFYAWDHEHKYPTRSIQEHVAYWRKANMIHKWFVENVQDGEDDCCYHREVRESDLEKLMSVCEKIINEADLVKGKVKAGIHWEGKKEIQDYREGMMVANPEVCYENLPCERGFFFGGQEYDDYYMMDIKHTYEVCKELLESTDFEKQMIFYRSSW